MVRAGWGKKWRGENKPNLHNPQGLKGLWRVHRAGLDFQIRSVLMKGCSPLVAHARSVPPRDSSRRLGRSSWAAGLSETRLIAPPGYEESRSAGFGGRLAQTCRRWLG